MNFNSAGLVVIDNVELINCTPHEIRFQNMAGEIITVPPCGLTLKADAVESVLQTRLVGSTEILFVKTIFVPSASAIEELQFLHEYCSTSLLVGSMVSAQAIGGRVVSLVPIVGFERVPPAEKRYYANKFNIY